MSRSLFLTLVRQLHRFPSLRRLARRCVLGHVITQPFHGGVICFDAVEHSWAWTGSRRLEDFDCPIQERVIELMQSRSLFVDVGCNIGITTLPVLLHHAHASALAIDPNRRALEVLTLSLQRNQLQDRARTLSAAVFDGRSSLSYDPGQLFSGHVAPNGIAVPTISLNEVLHGQNKPMVVKIDIAGHEAALAETLRSMPPLPGSTLIIELHPLGFNGMGNPVKVLAALKYRGDLEMRFIGGGSVDAFDPTQFHHLEVRWSDE